MTAGNEQLTREIWTRRMLVTLVQYRNVVALLRRVLSVHTMLCTSYCCHSSVLSAALQAAWLHYALLNSSKGYSCRVWPTCNALATEDRQMFYLFINELSGRTTWQTVHAHRHVWKRASEGAGVSSRNSVHELNQIRYVSSPQCLWKQIRCINNV